MENSTFRQPQIFSFFSSTTTTTVRELTIIRSEISEEFLKEVQSKLMNNKTKSNIKR